MASSFNFSIQPNNPLSVLCLDRGLNDFTSVCEYVKSVPYGRLSEGTDLSDVIIKNKGTCSTKHAFLKQVAIENNATDIKLCLGVYKMSEINTKGVGKVLTHYQLNYIPEAHMYLRIHDTIYDFTRTEQSLHAFSEAILYEESIQPNQITRYKNELHKKYIRKWLKSEKMQQSFEFIWKAREACIAILSQ